MFQDAIRADTKEGEFGVPMEGGYHGDWRIRERQPINYYAHCTHHTLPFPPLPRASHSRSFDLCSCWDTSHY